MAGRRRFRSARLSLAPVTVRIERLSHEGRGIAKVDGKTVFVEGALPGETAKIQFTQQRGQFDEARVLEILEASAERIVPHCAHAERCGGCSLQHLSSAAQLAHKESVLLELLQHQASLAPKRLLPAVTGPLWGYRRRARLSVKRIAKRGDVLIGFREKASHFVADLVRCETLIPAVGERLAALRHCIESLDCAEHIPQIEVAAGDDSTALVIRHLVPLSDADETRLREFAIISGLRLYAQGGGPDSIRALAGEDTPLHYAVAEVDFDFLPGDFVQVNAAINARIVPLAIELLDVRPDDRVLDLFCGLGNFTLPLARRAAHVVGIESDPGLVARATKNARLNGIENAQFEVADLFHATGIKKIPRAPYTKLLLDPPRSGAAEVLAGIELGNVTHVCYVSCNPVTLARDTASLVRNHGYELEAAGVLDMFPHTTHVESVALFTRPI